MFLNDMLNRVVGFLDNSHKYTNYSIISLIAMCIFSLIALICVIKFCIFILDENNTTNENEDEQIKGMFNYLLELGLISFVSSIVLMFYSLLCFAITAKPAAIFFVFIFTLLTIIKIINKFKDKKIKLKMLKFLSKKL